MNLILILILTAAGIFCAILMSRFSKKLGTPKGEPAGEIEDLDKMRSELLKENRELKKKIEFLGRPDIRDVEFTEEKLSYEALLEIPPSVKVRKYKGLSTVYLQTLMLKEYVCLVSH